MGALPCGGNSARCVRTPSVWCVCTARRRRSSRRGLPVTTLRRTIGITAVIASPRDPLAHSAERNGTELANKELANEDCPSFSDVPVPEASIVRRTSSVSARCRAGSEPESSGTSRSRRTGGGSGRTVISRAWSRPPRHFADPAARVVLPILFGGLSPPWPQPSPPSPLGPWRSGSMAPRAPRAATPTAWAPRAYSARRTPTAG